MRNEIPTSPPPGLLFTSQLPTTAPVSCLACRLLDLDFCQCQPYLNRWIDSEPNRKTWYTPPKLTWQWNNNHEWRCISYWKWGFSNVMLVFRGFPIPKKHCHVSFLQTQPFSSVFGRVRKKRSGCVLFDNVRRLSKNHPPQILNQTKVNNQFYNDSVIWRDSNKLDQEKATQWEWGGWLRIVKILGKFLSTTWGNKEKLL